MHTSTIRISAPPACFVDTDAEAERGVGAVAGIARSDVITYLQALHALEVEARKTGRAIGGRTARLGAAIRICAIRQTGMNVCQHLMAVTLLAWIAANRAHRSANGLARVKLDAYPVVAARITRLCVHAPGHPSVPRVRGRIAARAAGGGDCDCQCKKQQRRCAHEPLRTNDHFVLSIHAPEGSWESGEASPSARRRRAPARRGRNASCPSGGSGGSW